MPENKVHDYIYVDGDQLYVMLPVIGGNTIGLDNTCKTSLQLKDYFYNKKGLKSVRKYTNLLHEELEILGPFEGQEEQVARILNQLKDLKHYEEILVNFSSKKTQWVDQFHRSFPEIPAEIQQVVKEGKNLSSILLAPKGTDGYLRLNDYTFSLKRDRREVFAKELREGMGRLDITSKGVEELFNKASLNGVVESKEVGSAKARIKTIMDNMQQLIGEELNVRQLIGNKVPGEGEKSVDDVINYIQTIEGEDSLDDFTNAELFRNLNLLMDVDVSEIPNIKENIEEKLDENIDEQNIFLKEYLSTGGKYKNSNMKIIPAERLSIMLQLLLATVNIDQVSKETTTKNFGEVLDSDEGLSNTLIAVIKSLIEVSEQDAVERGVLGWINDNKEVFGLSKVMEEKDLQRIITDFKANYTVVKGSEHFDEFLIRSNVEGGKWVSYQNRMEVDLGYAVAKGFANDELCDDKEWLDKKVSVYEELVQKEGHELKPYHHQKLKVTEEGIVSEIQRIDDKGLLNLFDILLKKELLTDRFTELLLDKIDTLGNKDDLLIEVMNQCILNKHIHPLNVIAKRNKEIIYQRMNIAMGDKDEQVVLILLGLPTIDISQVLFVEVMNHGMSKVALKLLEQPEVRDNAHAKDNEALISACNKGIKVVALKLLEQPEVRDNAHAKDNQALRRTCDNGMSEVAMKLLEQKEVMDNAHADDNKALRSACMKGMPEVALKLLEQPKVLEKAHDKDNEALISACNKGIKVVAMKLLEQPKVREHAHAKDNQALRRACSYMPEVALELLKMDQVKNNAHVEKNGALKGACLTGMPEVALELLKLDPVKDNAHVDNNLALKYACCKGLKEVALE
ncbi:MAG TPA: hypothetical protein QF353_02500, partial [Gammaproteobacteria bacterium]|nr:hypothetical protein [Gammaproteobacteria bacterium]